MVPALPASKCTAECYDHLVGWNYLLGLRLSVSRHNASERLGLCYLVHDTSNPCRCLLAASSQPPALTVPLPPCYAHTISCGGSQIVTMQHPGKHTSTPATCLWYTTYVSAQAMGPHTARSAVQAPAKAVMPGQLSRALLQLLVTGTPQQAAWACGALTALAQLRLLVAPQDCLPVLSALWYQVRGSCPGAL